MAITTVHPLFTEWYTVNGESMATYGWSVESVTTGLPERKGENVTSPIMHGSVFREKRFGPRTDTWNIWVCDADPETGIIPESEEGKRAQFNENMDYVNRILNCLTPNGLNNGSLQIEKKYLSTAAFNIGDTGPGGGIIFITPDTVGNTTGKFFEAAPDDWSGGSDPMRSWAQNTPVDYQSTTASGADGTAIGTGYQNTLDIIAQGNSTTSTSAAALTRSYAGGGQTDWFLPSKDELTKIYNNKELIGGLENNWYWSSSEISNSEAWGNQLEFGTILSNPKGIPLFVRPVRMFSTGASISTLTAYAEAASAYSYDDAKQFNCATLSVDISYPYPLWIGSSVTATLNGTSGAGTTSSITSANIGNAPVSAMTITITANSGQTVVDPRVTNGTLANYPGQIGYTGTLTSGQSVIIDTSAFTITKASSNVISSLFRSGYRQDWFELFPGQNNSITASSTSGSFTVAITYNKVFF
jgi:hypothetical protein